MPDHTGVIIAHVCCYFRYFRGYYVIVHFFEKRCSRSRSGCYHRLILPIRFWCSLPEELCPSQLFHVILHTSVNNMENRLIMKSCTFNDSQCWHFASRVDCTHSGCKLSSFLPYSSFRLLVICEPLQEGRLRYFKIIEQRTYWHWQKPFRDTHILRDRSWLFELIVKSTRQKPIRL